MSHRATNWAIQQRGLAPATKLVLLAGLIGTVIVVTRRRRRAERSG